MAGRGARPSSSGGRASRQAPGVSAGSNPAGPRVETRPDPNRTGACGEATPASWWISANGTLPTAVTVGETTTPRSDGGREGSGTCRLPPQPPPKAAPHAGERTEGISGTEGARNGPALKVKPHGRVARDFLGLLYPREEVQGPAPAPPVRNGPACDMRRGRCVYARRPAPVVPGAGARSMGALRGMTGPHRTRGGLEGSAVRQMTA